MKEATLQPAAFPLARHISATFASSIGCLVLSVASSVLLNRSLGPDGKGLYATLLTTSQLIIILTGFALGKSVTFHLANQQNDPQTVFRSFLSLATLVVLVTLGALGLLSLLPIPHRALAGEHLPYLSLIALVSLAHSFALGALRGLRKFAICNLLTLGTAVIFIGFLVGFALRGSLTPHVALLCKTSAFGIVLVLLCQSLRTQGMPFRLSADTRLAKKMFAYGLGFFFYQIFQNLNYRFDLLLVSQLTSFAHAGWYSTGTGLSEIIWHFPNAVSAVLFPVAAGLGESESDALVARVCRWSLLIMALGAIALVLLAPVVIHLLYGQQFLPAVEVIYALSLGIITNGMFQILGIQLAARRHLRILTLITIVGFASNVGLNVTLIPLFGIVGAGISSSISYSISGLLTLIAYARLSGIAPARLLLIPPDEFREVAHQCLHRLRKSIP